MKGNKTRRLVGLAALCALALVIFPYLSWSRNCRENYSTALHESRFLSSLDESQLRRLVADEFQNGRLILFLVEGMHGVRNDAPDYETELIERFHNNPLLNDWEGELAVGGRTYAARAIRRHSKNGARVLDNFGSASVASGNSRISLLVTGTLLDESYARINSSLLFDSVIGLGAFAVIVAAGFYVVRLHEREQGEWERDMRSREDALRTIFDNVQTGIFVIDADTHTILSANPAMETLLGIPRDEIVGKLCHRNICPAERGACPITDLGKEVVNADKTLLLPNGCTRAVIKTAVLTDRDNNRRIIECVTDISERIKFEQSLSKAKAELEDSVAEMQNAVLWANEMSSKAEASNEAKSQFLANMSHEVRTPITAMLGYAELLLGECKDVKSSQYAEVIKRNGEALLAIVNDILDLAKVEAGKIELETVDVVSAEFAQDLREAFATKCQEKGIDLQFEFSDDAPAVLRTDPTRLRQIVANVLGNAIKFTENGEVRLTIGSSEEDRNLIRIDVVDAGIGMTATQIEKLFHPFTQADESTSRRFGGTGLGLAISRRLANALGGDVVIVSSEKNVGTHVRITIRNAPETGSSPASLVRPISERTTLSSELRLNLKALLAEDGEDNRRLIAVILGNAGIQIETAVNGEEAVRMALAARDAAKPYDVILLDMQMPVMDGYEAAKELRSRGFEGPIVALTAHAMVEDRRKCIEAGCDDYASKPIRRDDLLAKIAEWTSNEVSA